jgi:hypothetical protein
MVRIGNKPQLMNSSPFRRFTQCSIAFVNVFLPHRSQCLTRAAELVISPRCTAWQRGDSKLRAEKRRSQDLMSDADQFLVVSQLHGDVRADRVPGHGRPVPLVAARRSRLPQSTRVPSRLPA